MSDIPGDPRDLTALSGVPPLLPGSYLIGISHFPDPSGLGLERQLVQLDAPFAINFLYFHGFFHIPSQFLLTAKYLN